MEKIWQKVKCFLFLLRKWFIILRATNPHADKKKSIILRPSRCSPELREFAPFSNRNTKCNKATLISVSGIPETLISVVFTGLSGIKFCFTSGNPIKIHIDSNLI